MDRSKLACAVAALALGVGLAASTTHARAVPMKDPVIVSGQRMDPQLQRRVSYADLNLAFRGDRSVLQRRIYRTASDLCFDLNGISNSIGPDQCTVDAVRSTRGQVAAAVDRAKRQLAGLPVGAPIAISMVIATH